MLCSFVPLSDGFQKYSCLYIVNQWCCWHIAHRSNHGKLELFWELHFLQNVGYLSPRWLAASVGARCGHLGRPCLMPAPTIRASHEVHRNSKARSPKHLKKFCKPKLELWNKFSQAVFFHVRTLVMIGRARQALISLTLGGFVHHCRFHTRPCLLHHKIVMQPHGKGNAPL